LHLIIPPSGDLFRKIKGCNFFSLYRFSRIYSKEINFEMQGKNIKKII